MNTIVVIEDHPAKRRHECDPYPFGSALDVLCLCGARIHPIVGAWCPSGKTWSSAKFTGKFTKYGFRKWSFGWKAAEGEYILMSRATNEAGRSQPLARSGIPTAISTTPPNRCRSRYQIVWANLQRSQLENDF